MIFSGRREQEDFCCQQIRKEIVRIRNCYEEHSTEMYSDSELARMMLLDACFIVVRMETSIPALRRSNQLKLGENKSIMIQNLGKLTESIVLRDMFLLENQIPFWIIELLIDSKYKKDETEELLHKYLNISLFGEFLQKRISSENEEEILHLPEAFHRLILSEEKTGPDLRPTNADPDQTGDAEREMRYYIHSFRSVTDLKAKGIHLKASPNQSLKDVKFKSNFIYGELQLPTWFVSKEARVFFLNMIAYELSPNNPSNGEVTSCVSFMKSLIERPEDVKELREKKILLNTLGSDERVLDMYKEINTYGADNPLIFKDVKDKIQAHFNSKAKTWMAELIHTYFHSPWTAIALLAATFLLFLAALQTYFAALQTHYSALQTYYTLHPKPNK